MATVSGNRKCSYCSTEIGTYERGVSCTRCGRPHHSDCWDENGGCAIYGCSSRSCQPLVNIWNTAPVNSSRRQATAAAPQRRPLQTPPPTQTYGNTTTGTPAQQNTPASSDPCTDMISSMSANCEEAMNTTCGCIILGGAASLCLGGGGLPLCMGC